MPAAVTRSLQGDHQRIGWWGRLYPRVRDTPTHTSPLSAFGAGGLVVLNAPAFSLARQPVDLWPVAGKYRLDGCRLPQCGPIVPPASPPAVGLLPCMNLEVPARRGCHNAGVNLLNAFDQAAADGRYKWVVWKRRRCTLPMPLQACALRPGGAGKGQQLFLRASG